MRKARPAYCGKGHRVCDECGTCRCWVGGENRVRERRGTAKCTLCRRAEAGVSSVPHTETPVLKYTATPEGCRDGQFR